MIIVDSVGWLEYFTDGKLANEYEKYLSDLSQVITPTIIIYEVYKKVLHERGDQEALLVAAQLQKTKIIPLDISLSLEAAEASSKYKIPMADSIIYATSLAAGAKVVTSDRHFKDLPQVIYFEK